MTPFDPRHPSRVVHISKDGIPSIVKVRMYVGVCVCVKTSNRAKR